ncbi:MAG: hypothetical protein V2A65_04620 [Candidatus Omnitrophota bacterium]
MCHARKVQSARYSSSPSDSTSPFAKGGFPIPCGIGGWRGISTNALLPSRHIKECCVLTPEAADLLKQAMERFELSARSYDKLRKVSRTIADLDGSSQIEVQHISEALQYRALDRKVWL